MKKNIITVMIFLTLIDVSVRANVQQHGRHQVKVVTQHAHDEKNKEHKNEAHPVKTMGKKLTSPLVIVLDKAVQFRPEIMVKMQLAAGKADKVFRESGTKKILSSQEKKEYLEGILHHVEVFFDEMSQHSSRVVPLIRESLYGSADNTQGEHSFLLEYFDVVSTVGSQDTLLTYLVQKITTIDQLRTFCKQTKTFFGDVYASLSDEAKIAVEKFKRQLHNAAERSKEGKQ